jgi:CheY-like chemotaxis protein
MPIFENYDRPLGASEKGMVMDWLIAKLESDARNELHSVMGMLELIAEGPLAASQSNYLRACRDSADRLLRTIQNVSMLLSQEAHEAQTSNFEVQEIVESVTSLMEALAERKGLSLACVIGANVPRRMAGNTEYLEDILFRLLDNAVKFTERGRVDLMVRALPKDAKIWIQFDICDSGPGIPQDIIASLTTPISGEVVWQGLGLPIVRKLVSAMGGELSIGSGELGGASVTVSLPFDDVADSSPIETHAAGEDEPEAVLPLSILVAEDSDDSYYLLEAYLGERHRLCRAANGADAIEMFKMGHYDLVIMDVHMPGLDGYSATRAIREWESRGSRARIPIVVLSSDSPKTQLHHGAKAGCSAYLTKPVSRADIMAVLNRYCRAHSL